MKVKYFKVKKGKLHTPPDGAIGACHFCISGEENVISFDVFEFKDGSSKLFLPDETETIKLRTKGN